MKRVRAIQARMKLCKVVNSGKVTNHLDIGQGRLAGARAADFGAAGFGRNMK